ESVVGFVEVEELALLLHEGAATVEVVLPAVVLAHELATAPAGLLAREVLPHELVAAVATDVVKGADLAVLVAHDDDRCLRDGELLGEVAAAARELLDAAEIEPRALPDRVALELVELGRRGVAVGDETRSEIGVVLGPAALDGLHRQGHGAV